MYGHYFSAESDSNGLLTRVGSEQKIFLLQTLIPYSSLPQRIMHKVYRRFSSPSISPLELPKGVVTFISPELDSMYQHKKIIVTGVSETSTPWAILNFMVAYKNEPKTTYLPLDYFTLLARADGIAIQDIVNEIRFDKDGVFDIIVMNLLTSISQPDKS